MSPALRIVTGRPLFGVESEVCRLVDFLTLLEAYVAGSPNGLGRANAPD